MKIKIGICYIVLIFFCFTGELKIYKSTDSGDANKIAHFSSIAQKLYLKINAPVMLLVNLSSSLVNGQCGEVKGFGENYVEVFFPKLKKTVKIHSYNFSMYSKELHRDVASRRQIPLKLAFAMTTHKAQGLTLDRIEIDCRYMTNPGQIGVAVGRCRNMKGLRIINYSKHLVKKHREDVYDFYSNTFLPILPDLLCCKMAPLLETVSMEPFSNTEDEEFTGNDEDQTLEKELEDVDLIDNLFNNWEDEMQNLEERGHICQNPLPDHVNINCILEEIKCDEPLTEEQLNVNSCLSELQSRNTELKQFCSIIYDKLLSFFKDTIPKDEKIENKHTTAFYKKVTLFNGHKSYQNEVKILFQSTMPSKAQYRVCFGILQKLRSIIVQKASEPIYTAAREKAQMKLKNIQQSKGSRAKTRYIGGWCVAATKRRKKSFVTINLYKKSLKFQVNKTDQELKLLDQLSGDESTIAKCSKEQDSFSEIQRKQTALSTLTCITDEVFQFFLDLDTRIQQLETIENLNLHGQNFYAYIFSRLQDSKELKNSWINLFHDEDEMKVMENKESIDSIFSEILKKYIKMSSAQFRQEYKRELRVQKEEAHRKQIRMRADKASKQKLTFSFIIDDKSDCKMKSHLRLQSELLENDNFLEIFSKSDVMRLCKAYNLNVSNRMKKNELCASLKTSIQDHDTCKMPNSAILTAETEKIVTETASVQSPSTSLEDIPSPGPSKGGNSIY